MFLSGTLALFVVTGCGGGPDRPQTVPVSGTVTYNGEPVADANVTFYPEEGRPASGKTDAQGRFDSLTTFEPGDGAVVGKHTVTVNPSSEVSDEPIESGEAYAVPGEGNGGGGGDESSIPEKYRDKASSDQTFTVEEGGENDFSIELTD